MKKGLLLLYLLFFALSLYAQPAKPQQLTAAKSPESLGFSPERLSRIDAVMQEHVARQRIPGATMLLARKGQIVYYKAFGYQDVETKTPLQRDAIFRIMSMSKAITSVAVMLLYEEGKIGLDDPVSRYIPAFKNPRVLTSFNPKDTTYSAVPAKREVTIRHLLTHTAGIPYSHPLYQKDGIPDFFSLEPKKLSQTIPALGSLPLLHEPGEKYTYGLNTDVLGYLVEVVSGMRFGEFLQKRILEPLGMTDTGFYQPDSKKARLMHLYSRSTSGESLVKHPNFAEENYPVSGAKTYESGGAGLSSTVMDYAKFLQMLLNGGRFNNQQLLSRKTIELMTTNQIGELEMGGVGNKFGLGFEIETEKGHAKAPGSLGTLRWGGRNYSDYWWDPQEEILAVWTTQLLPNTAPGIDKQFKQLAYQALVD
ncbi:MAG: beta-lactamase family protein [Cytophagaceae bacterium]|nr:beta-lactamase family protein [Cytophagaceae bacterium]